MRRRYTVLVIDRSTGAIRRSTFSLRAIVGGVTLMVMLPILIGLGVQLRAREETEHLQTTLALLDEENASYRATTGALAAQIRSLERVIDMLGPRMEANRPRVTPRDVAALNRLRAVGGATISEAAVAASALTPSVASPPTPDNLLGTLRGALQVLSNRLPSLEQSVERREALAAATPSLWPTQGWLTAPFGLRSDPFTGERGFHEGIDISTAQGQPVFATADGVVESASYSGDYGNLVVLQHGFGLSTRYGHLSRFAVAARASVKRGEVIGYVGATGRATGPHVHYEILVDGTRIDPLQVLTTVTRR
jgi:murein DD-endopeptidase MepM/ murein hydrolase activator NlpD